MKPLVLTFALKQECPISFFKKRKIPVFTLKSLQAGSVQQAKKHVIMAIITGVGRHLSEEAALLISKELSPILVVNMGSAGVITPRNAEPITVPLRQAFVVSEITFEDQKYRCQSKGIDLPPTLEALPLGTFSGKGSFNAVTVRAKEMLATGAESRSSKSATLLDMEAFFQARVFDDYTIPFISIKVTTDRNDENQDCDFNSNLLAVPEQLEPILNWAIMDTSRVKVSTIIPTYNRADILINTINSALAQDLPHHEIVIVDDGSTDTTPTILDTLASAHNSSAKHDNPSARPEIKVITLDKNHGVSYARNRGIEHATGELIALLDSDDIWTPDKLSTQLTHLRKFPFLTLLQSQEKWIRNGKELGQKKYHQKKEGWIFYNCLERCLISPSSALFRRSVYVALSGFDEGLPACEDYALWLFWTYHYPIGLGKEVSLTKFGGHLQLSTQFSRMDHFRVIALTKFYLDTFGSEYTNKQIPTLSDHYSPNDNNRKGFNSTIDTLKEKLNVLRQGAEKRKNETLTTFYTQYEIAANALNFSKLRYLMQIAPEYNPQGFE
jgi:glycosyltransferase involved in cell wall biosynthesis